MKKNLLIPFQRDQKRDFANGSKEALLRSKVRQVLLTEGASEISSGELPWRTNFGSKLTRLRHRNNNETTQELAKAWALEAVDAWLPNVSVLSVAVSGADNQLFIRMKVKEGEVTADVDAGI